MPDAAQEYLPIQDADPWEDSDWIPSDAKILLPERALEALVLETPVSAIAIPDPVTIDAEATMQAALFRMRQRQVRALLVMEAKQPVGVVTDHDAVRTVPCGQTGASLRVRDVMTPNPVTIRGDETVGHAAQEMLVEGVHHLPVVDADGALQGIVALGPVLHSIIRLLLSEEADE